MHRTPSKECLKKTIPEGRASSANGVAPVAASAYGLTSVPLWGEVAWPKEVFIHITPLKLYVPTEGRTASAYGLAPVSTKSNVILWGEGGVA